MCQTRLDSAHGVVALQSELISPKVSDLKAANLLLKRTVKNARLNGLHFRQSFTPLRVVGVSDCGHATKKSTYPCEGKIVLIMNDQTAHEGEEWIPASTAGRFGGHAHPLYFSARKAT